MNEKNNNIAKEELEPFQYEKFMDRWGLKEIIVESDTDSEFDFMTELRSL